MQVYNDDEAKVSRLAELGLEEGRLAEVVARGYVAFASCTPNHPSQYPGLSAWAAMVCALREYLLPEGWDRCNDSNYPLTINPDGTIAIVVATGDDATGKHDAVPTTKSKKGTNTLDAVATNHQQLELFPALPVPSASGTDERHMTWILLVHRAQGELRAELSLPTSMGEDYRVNGWRERIILRAVQTDPAALANTPTPPAPAPDIVVDVKRRA